MNPLRLLPGESYKDRAFGLCGSCGDDDSHQLKDIKVIGPSILEVGYSSTCEPRSSISMILEQLGVIIGKSNSKAMLKLHDSSSIKFNTKPV